MTIASELSKYEKKSDPTKKNNTTHKPKGGNHAKVTAQQDAAAAGTESRTPSWGGPAGHTTRSNEGNKGNLQPRRANRGKNSGFKDSGGKGKCHESLSKKPQQGGKDLAGRGWIFRPLKNPGKGIRPIKSARRLSSGHLPHSSGYGEKGKK